MEIGAEHRDDMLRLTLSGDLDIYSVADTYTCIADAFQQAEHITLDLSKIDNIDASGVQLLMTGKCHARKLGKSFSLVQHSPSVIEAIELCQLERDFGDPLVLRPNGNRP